MSSIAIQLFPTTTLQSLRRDHILYGLIAFYSLAVYLLSLSIGLSDSFSLFTYSSGATLTLFAGAISFGGYKWASLRWTEKKENALLHFRHEVAAGLHKTGGILPLITTLFALSILISAFTVFKTIFPKIAPFSWDATFQQWDRALHFGIDPWVITHSLFGSPLATYVINIFYNMWFGFMWLGVCAAILMVHKPQLRIQYLLTFTLCWILLGSATAMGMSSAGPCFFNFVVPGDTSYAPLMHRLETANLHLQENFGLHLMTLDIQNLLWKVYSADTNIIGGGISAMPSMHVSIATLMALGGWQLNRKLGIACIIYAALIQIGSVHLGWHYAVDGYVSVTSTVIVWGIVGRLLRSFWV